MAKRLPEGGPLKRHLCRGMQTYLYGRHDRCERPENPCVRGEFLHQDSEPDGSCGLELDGISERGAATNERGGDSKDWEPCHFGWVYGLVFRISIEEIGRIFSMVTLPDSLRESSRFP